MSSHITVFVRDYHVATRSQDSETGCRCSVLSRGLGEVEGGGVRRQGRVGDGRKRKKGREEKEYFG